MLVVDRSVFAQLQAEHSGIDFMELSANLIRAQRHPAAGSSLPSGLDSGTTSKGLSPSSLGASPPAYEDIFGDRGQDLPPSYSEVSLMFRSQRRLPPAEAAAAANGSISHALDDGSGDTRNECVNIEINNDPSTSARSANCFIDESSF